MSNEVIRAHRYSAFDKAAGALPARPIESSPIEGGSDSYSERLAPAAAASVVDPVGCGGAAVPPPPDRTIRDLAMSRTLLRYCRPRLREILVLEDDAAGAARFDRAAADVESEWAALPPAAIEDYWASRAPLRAAISAALAEPRQ
jgi:hypothetical protein